MTAAVLVAELGSTDKGRRSAVVLIVDMIVDRTATLRAVVFIVLPVDNTDIFS